MSTPAQRPCTGRTKLELDKRVGCAWTVADHLAAQPLRLPCRRPSCRAEWQLHMSYTSRPSRSSNVSMLFRTRRRARICRGTGPTARAVGRTQHHRNCRARFRNSPARLEHSTWLSRVCRAVGCVGMVVGGVDGRRTQSANLSRLNAVDAGAHDLLQAIPASTAAT